MANFLWELEAFLKERKSKAPEGSYAAKLFAEGRDRILKKIAEEAGELIIAAKNKRSEVIHEGADLMFHFLLLLAHEGIELNEVVAELEKRHTPE